MPQDRHADKIATRFNRNRSGAYLSAMVAGRGPMRFAVREPARSSRLSAENGAIAALKTGDLLGGSHDPTPSRNWLGITLLQRCAAKGDTGWQRSASIWRGYLETEWSSTPLGMAARECEKEVVEWLLSKGANQSARGRAVGFAVGMGEAARA